jgi:hypothetical protein
MSIFEYECQVAVNGYQVINLDASLSPDRPRVLEARSKQTRRFNLFEFSSSVFLEFAQTPPTEDGIKEFADRYGPIIDNFPEWIEWWVSEIREMHRIVKLWEMSKRKGDYRGLTRAVGKKLIEAGYGEEQPGVIVELLLKGDASSASPRICIRPRTLLHALWAQLVLAIDGNLNLRACVQCRKWFTLEARRGRSDKVYCSDACRMRAYRERKGRR